jgi:hypothetical protein
MPPTLENIGELIATRTLTLDGITPAKVLIGKPQPMPDGPDWYCPYPTQGIGSGRVFYGAGVDEVQALIHALSMVGAELYCSDEYRDGRLIWDAGHDSDLGFPVPENIRDVLPGDGKSSG